MTSDSIATKSAIPDYIERLGSGSRMLDFSSHGKRFFAFSRNIDFEKTTPLR